MNVIPPPQSSVTAVEAVAGNLFFRGPESTHSQPAQDSPREDYEIMIEVYRNFKKIIHFIAR